MIRGMGASAPQLISTTGGALLTAAPFTGPAAPFVAIAGAVAELLGAIGIGGGCGQTCIAATDYANQSASLMQQNMQQYFSLPVPRPKSAQTAALKIFDQLWAGLVSVQACGNPSLGDAGKRCISERQRGGKYDDFANNRDPIANDPNVYDDAASMLTSVGGINPMLLLGAGLVLAAVVVN